MVKIYYRSFVVLPAVGLFLFFGLLNGVVQAKDFSMIPAAKLVQLGVNPKTFLLWTISSDGSLLVGHEPISDLKLKKQGFIHQLRLFYFGPKGFQKMRTLYLPIVRAQQSHLDEKGENLYIIGNDGADFYRLHFATKHVTRFFHRVPNRAGFRAYPLIYLEGGKFFFPGYFYDKDGYVLEHVVARLDSDPGNKSIAFTRVLADQAIRKILPGPASNWEFMPPDQAMYIVPTESKEGSAMALIVYDGTRTRVLDLGVAFGGFAATRNRVLYSIKRSSGERETLLKDFILNKTWTIGGHEPYVYHYLSHDGKTVLLAILDYKHILMTMYYGKEEDNFQLQPIPGILNVPFGTLRYSDDGKHWVFFNKDGLAYGILP